MEPTKTAFITGISGQDGSYLAELLLSKRYAVHGLVRRSSTFNRDRIEELLKEKSGNKKFFLHYGDLNDFGSLSRLIEGIRPDEIYNLGAQSHVRISFDIPEYTMDVVGLGAARILEIIRKAKLKTKFYQASSSEMFGNALEVPQNEKTPFNPQSPYAVAKVLAHQATVNYRNGYGLFACNGILFNHESPRRGENFVTRKITQGIAEILSKKRDKILLGNLDAKRDWGYAPEYVEAMWRMLQQKKPDDYVIATGETHTIREFLDEAFRLVGIKDYSAYIGIDPVYYRPNEVHVLKGDFSKAKEKLEWEPNVKFKELIRIILASDLEKYSISL